VKIAIVAAVAFHWGDDVIEALRKDGT